MWVLLRHDILGIVEQFPVLQGHVPRLGLLRKIANVKGDAGERLVKALKKLGPSYIKLGQVVSTRIDLLGEDVCQSLTQLQDKLEGFDGRIAIDTIVQELDRPLDHLFADFEPNPVSAASVAQVHKAVDLDGKTVAVKILRPGIEQAFKRDLQFLSWLASIGEVLQPRMRPKGIIEVYRQQIAFETDLRLEASAGAEFVENFASDKDMYLPKVDWSKTSKHVMTMEWVDGLSIDDKAGLLANGHDLSVVMNKAARLFFKSVFEHGYFHGDQHAGNMFVTDAGQIMFVDFGIMGRLPWKHRCFLADMMASLIARDYAGLAQAYVDQGYLPAEKDSATFALAIRAVVEPIIDQPLDKVSFAKLLGQLLQMGEAFGLEAQPEMFLLQKNMLMAEGISRQLTPNLNIWTMSEPLIREWVVANRNPLKRGMEHVDRVINAAGKLPGMVTKLETQLDQMNEQQGLGLGWKVALGLGVIVVVYAFA
ncbi:MAG: AarF/UbiB family protein [Alphaproteobacteria bacterium]